MQLSFRHCFFTTWIRIRIWKLNPYFGAKLHSDPNPQHRYRSVCIILQTCLINCDHVRQTEDQGPGTPYNCTDIKGIFCCTSSDVARVLVLNVLHHKTSFLHNVLPRNVHLYKTSFYTKRPLQNVLPQTSRDTKRPWIQNVLPILNQT